MAHTTYRSENFSLENGGHYQRNQVNQYSSQKFGHVTSFYKTWNGSTKSRVSLVGSRQGNDLVTQSQPNLLCLPPPSEPYRKHSCSLNDLNTDNEPSNYTLLEKVGGGTYSVVYKCKLEANGPILAAKVVKMNSSEGAPGTAIREASILKQLKHDNVVTLHAVIYKPRQLTLILEYIEDNLSKYMEKCDLPSRDDTVKQFSIHLFRGLKYIHGRNIIHRDLKPDNLLITNNGILKIASFEMARQRFDPMSTLGTRVVTLWYKPPEILLDGCKYDFGIDIWSAGCIVYEMMNGEVLFEGSDVATQRCQIFQVLGMPPPSYWPELRLNPRFQEIRTILEKSCSTVETTLETYDIKPRLRDRFTNSSNLHWRDNADAFKLLEACLQPYGPKRIAAKEALEMDFLVTSLVLSKINQTHFVKSQKSRYNISRRSKGPSRPDTPPRPLQLTDTGSSTRAKTTECPQGPKLEGSPTSLCATRDGSGTISASGGREVVRLLRIRSLQHKLAGCTEFPHLPANTLHRSFSSVSTEPPRALQPTDTGSSTRAKTTEYPQGSKSESCSTSLRAMQDGRRTISTSGREISGGDSYCDPRNAVGTASHTIFAPISSKGGSGTHHSSHPPKSSFQQCAPLLPSRGPKSEGCPNSFFAIQDGSGTISTSGGGAAVPPRRRPKSPPPVGPKSEGRPTSLCATQDGSGTISTSGAEKPPRALQLTDTGSSTGAKTTEYPQDSLTGDSFEVNNNFYKN